jgi:two-component system, NtrC family, sensor histidine kinase HydH
MEVTSVAGPAGRSITDTAAMFKSSLFLRVAAPTILLSLLLLSLCIAAIVYLYFQQASSADVLGENVSSVQVAHNLKASVNDLAAHLRKHDDQVGGLHQRLRQELDRAQELADKPEEKELVRQLEDTFGHYLQSWEERTGPGSRHDFDGALRILESEAFPVCRDLEAFNSQETIASESAHRRTVNRIMKALAGVAGVGALAGLLLGYGVASGLRRSIYQLSVRVRDAAGKLGQDLPAVVLTDNDDLHHLQTQMQGVVRDIEQVVEKLQQREREVLRAEQLAAVGQMAAGVAHELRNPLTSIKMLVQAQREETAARGLPPDDLQIIEQEIRRMERCLQTFLDFARPPRPERRPVNLAAVVERVFTLLSGRAKKQQVELYFTPPPVPVTAAVDPEQIHQLLVNLLLNALDAMPRGGRVDVELHSTDRGQVELRVADSGPGIAPGLLPRLFQPFVSGKETGLGLGLVISQRIAEDHGGGLRASNRPAGGACFVLNLPLAA